MPVSHSPARKWQGRSDPEDGPDAKRMHHLVSETGRRALLGFACEAGVIRNKGRTGASQGPTALRNALANLAAPARAEPFADLGDVVVRGDDLEEGQATLGGRVTHALATYERLVVIGGGHETAFGDYQGLASFYPEAKIGIINLDAHFDLRLVGENGASSGTPFAQIRELSPDTFDYLCLGIAEEANTQALFQRAEEWGVGTVSDHALIASPQAGDQAIEGIVSRSDLIYLTIDIDLLPAYQAPGVSAPAARGVPLATVEHIVTKILSMCEAHDCKIPLADIVELSPPNDRDGLTSSTAALFTRRLLCS
ncbi:formimidoylglutamase [uncultured Erythrobacter sp.]|uniref:formimidoylglutamase n=1 Tax=uncultured Erythrobacter sp. TaxID=263913 RepID=UPI00261304F0|nr:formimidoylglutamase [uncultured Erythrobacter sp.]